MKKLAVIITILIGFSFHAVAQNGDFRGFTWGNPLKIIQKSEKSPLVLKVNNDEIVYKDSLGGSACNVYYIFNDNDKLESGLYFFTKKYSNPELYIQDYQVFKNLLAEKYGIPTSEKENWHSNIKISDKNNYGQAVADGNLQLNATWNTERSVIKIVLLEVNSHPSLQIHYTASSLDELENKTELKNALKKL